MSAMSSCREPTIRCLPGEWHYGLLSFTQEIGKLFVSNRLGKVLQ